MAIDKAVKPDAASLLARWVKVFKAIPDGVVDDLEDVADMWTEPGGEHKNPGRGEIGTGPAQRMSGDGAEKMIREYSDPAPQQGLTQQYADFQRMMADWAKSLNARLDQHQKAFAGLVAVIDAMQKAQAEAAVTKAAGPAEDTFLGKAMQKLAKAKLALRKADLADETEADLRKSHLEQASLALGSAKRFLTKSMEQLEDEEEEGAEKAMTQFSALSKALAKAEEEDKEREEATEKAKAAAVKSESEAKEKIEEAKEAGEKEKKAEKEAAEAAEKAIQAATAMAMEDMRVQVQKALEGNAVMQGNISQLFDAVMGKSQQPGGAPEITKGSVQQVDFAKVVDQAIDDGRLSDANITKAMSIVQHIGLAKAGRVDQRIVDQEIEKSPAEVRDLFRVAA